MHTKAKPESHDRHISARRRPTCIATPGRRPRRHHTCERVFAKGFVFNCLSALKDPQNRQINNCFQGWECNKEKLTSEQVNVKSWKELYKRSNLYVQAMRSLIRGGLGMRKVLTYSVFFYHPLLQNVSWNIFICYPAERLWLFLKELGTMDCLDSPRCYMCFVRRSVESMSSEVLR